jgi:hypothetical protein
MEDHERTENANRPEPELLYHYTDQRGLDGILSSASIWATHYKFLNDFSERDHGFGFFSKAIERIHTQPGTTERFSKINLETHLHEHFGTTSKSHPHSLPPLRPIAPMRLKIISLLVID